MSLLRDRFYWSGMSNDVDDWIERCPRCIRRKTSELQGCIWTGNTSCFRFWSLTQVSRYSTPLTNFGRSEVWYKARWDDPSSDGGRDSSVVRAPDSWLKGRGFESLLERRENFFSRVDFLCWLLFRYPFHPRVTTVARKKSRSFCQKCRWQVTAKHAYTLRMWILLNRALALVTTCP